MKRTSMEEKSETALRTSLELATLYAALCPVPNIVGPAYGAAHCKRASNVVRAFERLLKSLEFSILRSTYYANQAELDAWRSIPPGMRGIGCASASASLRSQKSKNGPPATGSTRHYPQPSTYASEPISKTPPARSLRRRQSLATPSGRIATSAAEPPGLIASS